MTATQTQAPAQTDDVLGTASNSSGGGGSFVSGTYILSLLRVERAGKSKFALKDDDGNPKLDSQGNQIFPEQLKWVFSVDEVDAKRPSEAQEACIGQELHRWTNATFGMGQQGPSKARGYYEALIGRRMADNEQARLSAILHQQARALLTCEAGKVTGFVLQPLDEMVETPV